MTLDATEPSTGRPGTLANLRDVATATPLLRRGVLFRSDAPRSTDRPPRVEPWPPATVIDLRSDVEKGEPHPYRHASRIVDLPVLGAIAGDPRALADTVLPRGLTALYRAFASGSAADIIARAVREIATSDGSVLVHCTAGKDRTGVTVAATLRLLGADHADIAADYARTAAAMPDVTARLGPRGQRGAPPVEAPLPADVLAAPHDAITAHLDALDGYEGGAEGWFLAHGGDPGTLDALRARLLA